MSTKTDRILSYLPSTFRPLPRPTALYSLSDAFGGELQGAENSLAAVMQAHWVDHADRFEELLDDLPKFAALYGLGPRDEEEIEEFREHLKRYVRTFIEGTVTVQGILRIAADALGLLIADAEDELDAWWKRSDETLTTTRARLEDAAAIAFGAPPLRSTGADARPASVTGESDLADGVDVRGAPNLVVAIDGGAPVGVDLSSLDDPAAATATKIAEAINAAAGAAVADGPGGRLRIASPNAGAASRLAVEDVDGDAAPLLLGLRPRRARGRVAAAATLAGRTDLSTGVELDPLRYVRLRVDRTHEAEVDLRGAGPAHASADDLRARINDALGTDVAVVEGNALVLRSPTEGAAGSIELLAPAAQDATALVFGDAPRFVSGEDEQPARIVGHDVSEGLDLRDGANLAVAVDGAAAVTVDCAGADPAATRPGTVVERLNAALGPVAGYDGRSITLASLVTGAGGTIAVETPAEGDATETVLGIGPRSFAGADAVDARLPGPAGPVDLRAEHVVRVEVDDGPPREVDLRAGAADAGAVTPAELAQALDDAFGQPVSVVEGGRLFLASPSPGGAGSVEVEPLDETIVRRFVTRAFVRGEAAETLLGVLQAEASGKTAAPAAIAGQADLSHAVDLRDRDWLRIAVDGGPPQDVLVAGARPRATTLDEVVEKINGGLGASVAQGVDGRLRLVSTRTGVASRMVLTPPSPEDALLAVGLAAGTVHGRDAVRVSFLGTVDVGGGVDIGAAAAVRLNVDGDEHEVDCAGADPAHTTIDEIVTAINTVFGARVALIEGPRIRLQSQASGAASTLELLQPVGADATRAIFGVDPPRSYHGEDAQPARLIGTKNLAGGLGPGPRRFLRITVDARSAVSVDLGAGADDADNPSLDEAIEALTAALGPGVASRDDGHLVLASPTPGAGGRLTLEPHLSRDAFEALLGDAPADAQGSDGTPATITGTVDLLQPVDLSRRGTLVLSFDGGRPEEIDVAGEVPATTFLDEVVAAIDAHVPGLAEATEEDRLRLTWPGERLAVLPARVLEVVEYPAQPVTETPVRVGHGQAWTIDDDGAAESEADIELLALRGIAAPAIVNVSAGVEVRVLTAVDAGGRLRLWRAEDGGLDATVTSPSGLSAQVSSVAILVEPVDQDAHADEPLRIVRGRSEWRYLECTGTRFDFAHFDVDSFSGGRCTEVGVFDASRWGTVAGAPVSAVFGDAAAPTEPSVEVTTRWTRHAPGSFAVNLPSELPARFGARFNDGRFGSGEDQVEHYPAAVTEPEGDPDDLARRVHEGSHLLDADHVDTVPLGWSPVTLPFRKPQRLTIGVPGEPARLFLREEDVPGFVELRARETGPQGTAIVVTAPRSGPAQFDVTVSFEAGRFESARETVAGRPLSASADDLLRPGPIGVLEAKAAGIRAAVQRERTVLAPHHDHNT